MGRILTLCLTLAAATAQEVTWLRNQPSDFIASTPNGTRYTVETTGTFPTQDLRIRKFPAGASEPEWTRTIGGSGNEDLRALQTDPAGALFLLGNTSSQDLPTTPGVLAPNPSPGTNTAFLLKIDPLGNTEFSTYLHQGAAILAESLLLPREDEIILALTGRLWRLNPKATRLTAETLSPWISGPMRLDGRGSLWIAGATQSDSLPIPPSAFQTERQSGTCFAFIGPVNCATGFLLRLNDSTGAVESGTYLGGRAPASITAIAFAPDGSPIVTGNVRGGLIDGDFPTTPGAFQPALQARGYSPWFVSRDISISTPFVARLSPNLDRLIYATYLAGSRAERANWISVDESGRAIVAGDTVSREFPGTGAFAKPCGPDPGPNAPSSAFIARLSPDGSTLESAALLFHAYTGLPEAADGDTILAPGKQGLARVALQSPARAVVACILNGASFRAESFVAPTQLLTLIGAGIAPDARLLFDGVPAELLYLAPDQINAVVPPEIRDRPTTELTLESNGAQTALGSLAVQDTNPTIKVYVRPDGTLEDRGNPLADIRLENGAQNGTSNPAHRGDWVDIYTTGINPLLPVEIYLPDHQSAPAAVTTAEDSAGGVQKLRIRIPATANGGVVTIAITNGGHHSAGNGGFVWVE